MAALTRQNDRSEEGEMRIWSSPFQVRNVKNSPAPTCVLFAVRNAVTQYGLKIRGYMKFSNDNS